MKTRLLAALCVAALAAPALAANPLDLNFTSAPDPRYWTAFTVGTGPTAALANGELDITVPADSLDSITGAFGTGLTSRCAFQGDFDVVLRYKLIDWPFSNGVRAGIVIGGISTFAMGAVERTSFGVNDHDGLFGGAREVYLTHTQNQGVFALPTSDTKGKLRLVRSGDTITGFYMGATDWTTINTDTVTTSDVTVSVQAWSHNANFTGRPVKLAFTGFDVKSGILVCPK